MSTFVKWASFICFALAALVHIGFFYYESVVMQKKAIHPEVKLWALNQGFYNLFLALGMFWGLSYVLRLQIMAAGALTGFCGLSMLGAAIVLYFSVPAQRKLALLQAVFPILGFIFLSFHIAEHLLAN